MISIVIPAYNEEENITNCLNAFLSQKTKRPFELILVDNNSTDRTAEIAKTYEGKLNIKIIADPIKVASTPFFRHSFYVSVSI